MKNRKLNILFGLNEIYAVWTVPSIKRREFLILKTIIFISKIYISGVFMYLIIREVKHDVYGKRQTAKMKLLPSVFSSLYSRIKIFVFAVSSKRHFSIFVWFI